MSEVKLVRRIKHDIQKYIPSKSTIEKSIREETAIQIVAIGASTGGPLVVQKILSDYLKIFQFQY